MQGSSSSSGRSSHTALTGRSTSLEMSSVSETKRRLRLSKRISWADLLADVDEIREEARTGPEKGGANDNAQGGEEKPDAARKVNRSSSSA